MQRRSAIAVGLVLTVACSGAPEERSPDTAVRSRGSSPRAPAYAPELMPLPSRAARRCRATPGIDAVCPAEVPRIEGRTFLSLQTAEGLFSAEWGVGRSGITRRRGPMRFSHLVVQGGWGASLLPFEVPETATSGMEIDRRRERALLIGRPRWTGTPGALLLAPPYPTGGINGDHLVYLWRAGGDARLVSLHAWQPLGEATATLRAVVKSIRR